MSQVPPKTEQSTANNDTFDHQSFRRHILPPRPSPSSSISIDSQFFGAETVDSTTKPRTSLKFDTQTECPRDLLSTTMRQLHSKPLYQPTKATSQFLKPKNAFQTKQKQCSCKRKHNERMSVNSSNPVIQLYHLSQFCVLTTVFSCSFSLLLNKNVLKCVLRQFPLFFWCPGSFRSFSKRAPREVWAPKESIWFLEQLQHLSTHIKQSCLNEK